VVVVVVLLLLLLLPTVPHHRSVGWENHPMWLKCSANTMAGR